MSSYNLQSIDTCLVHQKRRGAALIRTHQRHRLQHQRCCLPPQFLHPDPHTVLQLWPQPRDWADPLLHLHQRRQAQRLLSLQGQGWDWWHRSPSLAGAPGGSGGGGGSTLQEDQKDQKNQALISNHNDINYNNSN